MTILWLQPTFLWLSPLFLGDFLSCSSCLCLFNSLLTVTSRWTNCCWATLPTQLSNRANTNDSTWSSTSSSPTPSRSRVQDYWNNRTIHNNKIPCDNEVTGLQGTSRPLAVNNCCNNCPHNISGCSASPYMVIIACSANGSQCDSERSGNPVVLQYYTIYCHHYIIITSYLILVVPST